MADAAADPVATYLQRVQTNVELASGLHFSDVRRSSLDVPRLVAAIEAVLKPHQPGRFVIAGILCPEHGHHRFFSITDSEAADVAACPDCPAAVYRSCSGCPTSVRLDKCPVRSVITRELLAKGE